MPLKHHIPELQVTYQENNPKYHIRAGQIFLKTNLLTTWEEAEFFQVHELPMSITVFRVNAPDLTRMIVSNYKERMYWNPICVLLLSPENAIVEFQEKELKH